MTDFDDEIDEMQPEEYEDQIDDLRVRGLIDAPAAETETVKHAPGRLTLLEGMIFGHCADDPGDPHAQYLVADAFAGCATNGPGPKHEANARRLVACWNACQRFSTEALEAGAVGELLEACQKLLERMNCKPTDAHCWNEQDADAVEDANAAIAKATKH